MLRLDVGEVVPDYPWWICFIQSQTLKQSWWRITRCDKVVAGCHARIGVEQCHCVVRGLIVDWWCVLLSTWNGSALGVLGHGVDHVWVADSGCFIEPQDKMKIKFCLVLLSWGKLTFEVITSEPVRFRAAPIIEPGWIWKVLSLSHIYCNRLIYIQYKKV